MPIHLSDHFTFKKLLRFTLPSIVMMVFTSLYVVVDGVFVTNFAGKSALAAVNFVFPILNILATFGYMFGLGGSALVAKTMGEGDNKKANSLFSLFVYLTTAIGIVCAVAGFFFLRPLMSALGAEGKMLDQAVLYGNILLIALPFWSLQFLFQIFFVTAEKPRLGLVVTLIAGGANMVLDALFVAVFDWGIMGAAWATAISQISGGVIPVVYFFLKRDGVLHLGKTTFDGRACLKATTNGMSELISGVSGSLVGILYNTQLLRFAGEDGVAAYSIMMYVSFVFVGIFFGYANGSAPIVSFHFGAKNRDELRNLRRKGLIFCVTASAIMLILSQSLARLLAQLFAGYDPVLYALTLRGFRMFAVAFLFSGIAIFGPSFFTALNNGLISGILSFMRTVVFQVALVLLLPTLLGTDGIWLSFAAAEALAAIMGIIFMIAMRRKYGY